MILSEVAKIINAGPPIDADTTGLDGVYVSMANYKHLTAIIQVGVTAGAGPTITVEKSATGSGAGTAIAFYCRDCVTAHNVAGGDTYYGSAGFKLSTGYGLTTDPNTFAIVELDGAELGGCQYVRVRLSAPAAATLLSLCYILTEARYAEEVQPQAIKV